MDFVLPSRAIELFVILSVKATLVLTLIFVVCSLVKLLSASFRHFVISVALILIALLPLSSLLLPAWEVIPFPVADAIRAVQPVEKQDTQGTHSSTRPSELEAVEVKSEETANISAGSLWLNIVVFVYILGAIISAARLAANLCWVWWLRKTGEHVSPKYERIRHAVFSAARQANLHQSIEVLFSSRLSVPIACGWLKPAILLPVNAADWSSAHLRSIILHEMAHLKRRDELTSTVVQFAAIWQWFNPLVWVVLRRCYMEREKACDDFVITAGVRTVDYATHLLAVGQAAALGWPTASIPAMARKKNIENRLQNILDGAKNRNCISGCKMVLFGFLIFALVSPLASLDARPPGNFFGAVTPTEQVAITNSLKKFYSALSYGLDYEDVCRDLLAADYFDRAELTLENRAPRAWGRVRKQMTASLYHHQLSFRPAARARITAMRKENGKCIVSQLLNIVNRDSAGVDTYLVKDLEHTVEMVKEGSKWKISRYDDGLSLLRRSITNKLDRSFLIWVNDRGDDVTPLGPLVIEVAPEKSRTSDSYYFSIHLEE